MDMFSLDTLTQFAMCTIPFSFGLYSYAYYKSATSKIKYNKKLYVIIDKLSPKYIELVEQLLLNLASSYTGMYNPLPTSSFDFKFGENLKEFSSKVLSPKRHPSPINNLFDSDDNNTNNANVTISPWILPHQ